MASISEFVVRELELSVCMLWSCSFDQSEVLAHSGDWMFAIDLSSVSEVEGFAVVLQLAQHEVCAIHGYAIIGIQGVVEDDVDEMSLFKLFLPLPSCHIGKCSS